MDSISWNENNLENESPQVMAGESDPNLSALADKMQFLTLGVPNVSRRPTRFNTNAWSTPLRSIENQQSQTTREQIYKTGSNLVDTSLIEIKSDDVDGNSLSNLSDLLPDQSIFEKTSDFIEFCLTFPEESKRIDVSNKTTLATPTRQIRSSYEPIMKPNVANSDLSPPEKMSPTQELLPNVSDRECFAGEATSSAISVDNELLTNMGSPLLPSSPKLVEAKLDDSANSSKLLNYVTDCLHPQSLVINEQRPRSPKSPFLVTCDENEVESDENALLPEDSIDSADREQIYVSDSPSCAQENVINNLTTVVSSPVLQLSQTETSADLILSRNEQVDGPFASLKSSVPEEPSVDLKGFCELEATQNTSVFSLRMSCGIDESSCMEDERDTSARSFPSLLASDRFSNIVECTNGVSIGSDGPECSVPNVGTFSPKELTSFNDQTHFSTRISPNSSPKSWPPRNSVEVGYPSDTCVAVLSNATEEEVLQIGTSFDDNVKIVPSMLLETEEGASMETNDCFEDCVDSQNSSSQIRCEVKYNVSCQPSNSVEVGYHSDTCVGVLSNVTEEEVLQIGASLDDNVKIIPGMTEEGASTETNDCSEDCVGSQNSSFQIRCEVKDELFRQPSNSIEVRYPLDTCVAGLPNAIEEEMLQIGTPLNDNIKIVPDVLLDTEEGASKETNDCFEDCVDSQNSSFQIRCEVKDNVSRQPSNSVEVGYPSDTCVAVLSNATEEEVLQIGTSLDDNVKIVPDVTEEGASTETNDCFEDCVDSQNSSFQIRCEVKHQGDEIPSMPRLKSTVNDPSCLDGENWETRKNESFSECQVKEDCHSEEVVSLDGATFGETTIISTCAKKAASNTVGLAMNKLMSLCTPVKEIRTPCRTTPFRCENFGKGGQRIIFDLPTNLLDVSIGMLESMTAMMAPAESASSAMYQGDQNLTSNLLSGARTPKVFAAISNQPSSSNSPANSDNCPSVFNINTQLLEENTNLKSDIEEYKMKYDVLQEEYQSLLKTASAVRTNETTLKKTLQEYEDEIRKVNNKYLILKEYANVVILSLNSSLNRLEDELREKNDEIRKLKNAS